MDDYDIEVDIGQLALLNESMWDRECGGRSTALSPLYIERFRGDRTSIPLGYHQFWELICIVEGTGELCLEGHDNVPLEDNRVLLLPPGISHAENSLGKLDVIWVGCRGHVLGELPSEEITQALDPGLTQKFLDLWKLSSRGYGMIGMELDGRCLDILGCFRRMIHEGEGKLDAVERAVNYINERSNEEIDIADLASRIGCSEGHLYRQFKKKVGMTPVSYVLQARIRTATQWLQRSDLKVRQIADLVGFNDQFYFSRVFKKTMGVSPRQYRSERRESTSSTP